eukprot:12933323-Alexandrium_andersonii.AAC.1
MGSCGYLRSSPGGPPPYWTPQKAPPSQSAEGAAWGCPGGSNPPGEELRQLQKPAENCILQ